MPVVSAWLVSVPASTSACFSTYVAVKVVPSVAPGARLGIGPPDRTRSGSGSESVTFVSVTLPVFVIAKPKVTVSPASGGVDSALVSAVLTSAIAGEMAGATGVGVFSPPSSACPFSFGSGLAPFCDRSDSCGFVAGVCPDSAPSPVTVAWFS